MDYNLLHEKFQQAFDIAICPV